MKHLLKGWPLAKWLSAAVATVLCCFLISVGVTQEVPIGQLSGRIAMDENGKPLSNAVVTVTPVVDSDEERPKGRAAETGADGSFRISNLPAGEYHLEVRCRYHEVKEERIEIAEGRTTSRHLDALPRDKFLDLYASQRVFTPDETPKVELHGFITSSDVAIRVFRLDVAKLARFGGLQRTLSPYADPEGEAHKLGDVGTPVSNLSHRIVKRDAEGGFIEALPVGRLAEGYYYIRCEAETLQANVALCVSRLALVTKTYRASSLCFASDLRTGKPEAGVEILAQTKQGLRHAGITDAQGLAEVVLPPARGAGDVLVGREGNSLALVGLGNERESPENVKIVGYCERPAYRPGDEIHFKGIVRRVSRDGYRLAGTGTAEIEILDPDGVDIEHLSAPISAHGTFSGAFSTSPEAKPGSYTVKCHAFGADSENIGANVVAYRKPEFSIEVTTDRPYYVMGGRASATVECRYYYGGPVVGATVKATITRTPAYVNEASGDDEDESNQDAHSWYGAAGEYSQEVEAVTDASGKARITFDTRAQDDPDVFNVDYDYGVSVSVSEDEGKSFEGEGNVTVARGDYDLIADVQNPVVSPGETVDLLLRTVNVLDAHKPAPGRPVTVEVGREVWTRNTSVFLPKGTYQAITGPDGQAHVRIPVANADSIAIRAYSDDAGGRRVAAETFAYVEGSPARAEAMRGTLSLKLDHKRYAIGDIGRALVQTDMPGGSALVCVQANGIFWRKVVPITSTSTIVHFPVMKEAAPNAYVSVTYVRQKHLLQDQSQVRVSRTDRDLRVTVTPSRTVYTPGDTASVDVATTDAQGRPAAADVSVGVVDEGVYAIAEDDTNIGLALYPRRSDEVRTAYSFPVIYLDGGDKGSSKVPLRTRFRDTAFWTPTVWTGPTGKATLSFPLPDNLTAWRVTAVGISDATQVGMTKATFRERKPLMARLELPQFLIDGDRQRMTVIVTNDTGHDQDVNVELQGEGVELDSAERKTIRVPNGLPQVVEYQMRATKPGQATLTARAWVTEGPSDGVRQSFPIKPRGRVVIAARAGEGPGSIELPIGGNVDPAYGSLEIHLSPTLAGGLVSSLDKLIGFPYGCVEQTMSRFLPSVLVAKTVRDLGLPEPKHLKDLPKIVRDSLVRLDRMRHADGGWGWWEFDESSVFMTSLVLDGLDRVKAAGWNVSEAGAKQAVEWGVHQLQHGVPAHTTLRDRIYLAYALLRWGHPEAAKWLNRLKLDRLSAAELATAALAFDAATSPEKAKEAAGLLVARAVSDDTMAYWAPEPTAYAWGEEVTGVALVALERVRPDDPIIPRVVRYLMQARKGEDWESTRDSAYALMGLTAYLHQTKELAQASTATITVNGAPVGRVSLDPQVVADPSWTIKLPRRGLGVSGPVRIRIEKEGSGKCYYSAELTTLDREPQLKPTSTDPGLRVVRQYFRLEPRILENGTKKLLPSSDPVDRYATGELVRVQLTITTDVPRNFVLIEEPTPSSCRVAEREEPGENETWDWWWSRTVMLDDRVAFFATYLPEGTSVISYTMRAEEEGKVSVMPTHVDNMYDPSRAAYSAQADLEVTK